MRIISRSTLLHFVKKHSEASRSLDAWYRLAKLAKWKNFEELKNDFGAADVVSSFTVFNIKGNHYRLIADVQYSQQIIFIKYVLTHREYDKDEWKQDPYYR